MSEVDLDQLADFAAGALEHDEAAAVAQLLATDPDWAAAHAALVAADATIRAELASLPLEPMPVDIASRIDAALRGARPVVVSLDAARQRSRRRFATSIAAGVAAAAVAVAGVGYVLHTDIGGSSNTSAAMPDNAGRGAVEDKGVPAAGEGSSGPEITASGQNYTADTLGDIAGRTAALASSAATKDLTGMSSQPLPQFATPANLNACLAAVRATHPGIVKRVDFARFNGAPALVLLIEAGTDRVAVAVGPDCGTAGPDEIASRHL
jgi:anti-sigma factor RsiW